VTSEGPSSLPLPPASTGELAALDAALERSARWVTLEQLRESGHRSFRVFQRNDVLREVLQVVEAFLEDRLERAQADLGSLVERREREAHDEGTHRVLASLIDVADILDAMATAFGSGQPALAAKSLDQRLAAIFRTHGFERIPTVGQPCDPRFHEIVESAPAAGTAEGTILREVGRGYRKPDFVLRVARVVVAAPGGTAV